MHVCFVDRGNAHSIWSLIDAIAIELLSQGHTVTYCKFLEEGTVTARDTPQGVNLKCITVSNKKTILGLFKQIVKFSHEFNKSVDGFDVLHTNFVLPGAFAKFIGRNKVSFILTTQHEIYHSMSPHWRFFLWMGNKFTHQTVYISEQVKKSFARITNDSSSNIIIKNGVDTNFLERIAKNNPSEANGLKVICPGRLVKEKGQRVLVEAWPSVLNIFPKAVLYLPGEGVDQNYLQKRCTELEINHSVKFLGWLEKTKTLGMISSSNIIIVPSDGTQEGFGLVVAEAMALKTPLICSDIPVFKEVAGDTATYFKVDDASDLSQVIINKLQSHSCNNELVNKAYSRIVNNFEQKKMVAQYIDLYESHCYRKG